MVVRMFTSRKTNISKLVSMSRSTLYKQDVMEHPPYWFINRDRNTENDFGKPMLLI